MNGGVLDRLIEMEERDNLPELRIGDFCPWGYLRWHIYAMMERAFGELEPEAEESSTKEKIKKFFIFAKQTRGHKKILPCKYLFVSHPRRFLSEGKQKCIYTDDLAASLGEEALTVAFGFVHKSPEWTKRLYYPDHKMLSLLLSDRIRKLSKEEYEKLYAAAEKIASAAEKEYGKKTDPGSLFLRLCSFYRSWKRDKERYREMLQRSGAKAVVLVVGYTTANMILIEAAHELKLPVIELQHGVMGSGHFAYNYGAKHDLPYYPDYVLTWGDYWNRTARFPLEADRVISCGYPYMEEAVKKWGRYNGTKPVLTVLSQPVQPERIAGVVIDFAKLARENGRSIKIYYKLHPIEYDRPYDFLKELKELDIEIIKTNEVTVYELFSKSNMQVGAFTTALFEGLIFDLRTFVINNPKAESYMGDLIRSGSAELVEDGEELFRAVFSEEDKKRSAFDRNEFFKADAFSNLMETIRQLT